MARAAQFLPVFQDLVTPVTVRLPGVDHYHAVRRVAYKVDLGAAGVHGPVGVGVFGDVGAVHVFGNLHGDALPLFAVDVAESCDGRGRSVAGRRHQLGGGLLPDVAGGVQAWLRSVHGQAHRNVPGVVQRDEVGHRGRVGIEAHVDEQPAQRLNGPRRRQCEP